MFLSVKAKQLLDERNEQALRELPIDELLNSAALENIKGEQFIFQIPESVSSTVGGPSIAQDSVSLSTLVDPVVVSSGHIFSRETALQLFSVEPARCPNTREPLVQNYMLELPQITMAIALWKLEYALRSMPSALQSKENDATIPLAMTMSSTTANLTNVLMTTHTVNDCSLKLTVKIGCGKVRILVNGDIKPLAAFFGKVFQGKNNDIYASAGSSYKALPWTFTWGCKNQAKEARLEFWYGRQVLDERVSPTTDETMNQLIAALLKPLNLPPVNEKAPATISLKNLGLNEYVTVINELVMPGALKTGECFVSFLKDAHKLRQTCTQQTFFEDAIIKGRSKEPIRKFDIGVRAIGAESHADIQSSTAAPVTTESVYHCPESSTM